jgi:hypothetical protein
MGLSLIHSSEVPLVLNMATGSITPQFHVVFDDEFSTVTSLEREHEPPPFWNDLCLENSVYIPVEQGTGDHTLQLNDDWLTPEERVVKQREIVRLEEIRNRINTTLPRGTDAATIQSTISAIPRATPNSDGVPPSSAEYPTIPTIPEVPTPIPVAAPVLPTVVQPHDPYPLPSAQ